MDWKNNLHEALAHRINKTDTYKEEYSKVLESVIIPTLSEIKEFLDRYRVKVEINANLPNLKVSIFGFDGYFDAIKIKFGQNEDKVEIIIDLFDYDLENVESTGEIILKRTDTEMIDIDKLTGDLIGNLVTKYIKEYRHYLK